MHKPAGYLIKRAPQSADVLRLRIESRSGGYLPSVDPRRRSGFTEVTFSSGDLLTKLLDLRDQIRIARRRGGAAKASCFLPKLGNFHLRLCKGAARIVRRIHAGFDYMNQGWTSNGAAEERSACADGKAFPTPFT